VPGTAETQQPTSEWREQGLQARELATEWDRNDVSAVSADILPDGTIFSALQHALNQRNTPAVIWVL
jgi:hypothetical protein